jgi:hypothetical protein
LDIHAFAALLQGRRKLYVTSLLRPLTPVRLAPKPPRPFAEYVRPRLRDRIRLPTSSLAAFEKLIVAETEKWGKVIREAKIPPQ